MNDSSGTMRSMPEPFGFAVSSKEEADKFLKENWLYQNDVKEIVICETFEEVKKLVKENYEKHKKDLNSFYSKSNKQLDDEAKTWGI